MNELLLLVFHDSPPTARIVNPFRSDKTPLGALQKSSRNGQPRFFDAIYLTSNKEESEAMKDSSGQGNQLPCSLHYAVHPPRETSDWSNFPWKSEGPYIGACVKIAAFTDECPPERKREQ